MVRPFLLGETETKKLAALREYAEQHPFCMRDLLEIKAGTQLCAGDRPEFMCEIPVGFKVVFTLQPADLTGQGLAAIVMTKHLSVSVDSAQQRLPNPGVVELLMKQLGMEKDMSDCYLYFEIDGVPMSELPDGHELKNAKVLAINVAEVLEDVPVVVKQANAD